MRVIGVAALCAALLSSPRGDCGAQTAARPAAAAALDRAITRMGGETALRAIRTVRLEMMTQWQRTVFGDHPYADQPSYERNSELRDYAARLWRNTRQPGFLGAAGSLTNIVRDTVAGSQATAPNGQSRWNALSVAYVDERRELWAFAPERMLLLARDAADLRMGRDTVINALAHDRVTATIEGYSATIFLRRGDALPAMVRFRADETNDMGLAPWETMEVEFWFSSWQVLPTGVLLPRQRDVRRVGRPYKRMTVLSATLNAPAPADSFTLSDSIVSAFFATQNKPMWDVPLDSAKIVAEHFASFGLFSGFGGAVKVGGVWVLLEAGQASGVAPRVEQWLSASGSGTRIGAAIITRPGTGNGGIRWMVTRQVPVYVAPGAAPYTREMLAGKPATRSVQVVSKAQWVKVGSDSLWLEPIDTPDAPGSMIVYSPTLRWVYALTIGSPVFQADLETVLARLRARGLAVERLGSLRNIFAPAPPPR